MTESGTKTTAQERIRQIIVSPQTCRRPCDRLSSLTQDEDDRVNTLKQVTWTPVTALRRRRPRGTSLAYDLTVPRIFPTSSHVSDRRFIVLTYSVVPTLPRAPSS